MHLLNTQTLQLEEHIDNIPPYVILSHTWGDQEVSYQEMMMTTPQSPETQQKAGYTKILATCHLAQQILIYPDEPISQGNRISHVWIDTCCIDKSSSAHLTENINSMYEFYTRARLCIVHLVDLPLGVTFKEGLKSCRWITRGWTLQEMIASREIHFYSSNYVPDGDVKEWKYLGTKAQFSDALAEATNVPRDVLTGSGSVGSYSLAQRMLWASKRITTRPEDMAYCLLGIFGVNMPLIYGERDRAFRRLQEHIIKGSNDMTIFAWEPVTSSSSSAGSGTGQQRREHGFCSIFAPSPANFQNCNMIRPWSKNSHDPEYTITNKGLRMQDYLYYVPRKYGRLKRDYGLPLGVNENARTTAVGVHLRKLGPDMFLRERRGLKTLSWEYRNNLARVPSAPFYILGDEEAESEVEGAGSVLAKFRKNGIRFPGQVSQKNIIPQGLWDSVDRCFLPTNEKLVRGFLVKMKLVGSEKANPASSGREFDNGGGRHRVIQLGLLLDWAKTGPSPSKSYNIRLFDTAKYEKQTREIFSLRRYQEWKEGLRGSQLETQYPEIWDLGNQLRVETTGPEDGSVFVITASTVSENVEGFHSNGQTVDMYRVVLSVREETARGGLIREMDGMDLLVRE
ncbi:hypothetical protein QBC37DRAFT_418571 [Rhypophila decipiens]|uniref:Heterokaryon incompatibility domain-containing protein n=1 Tax=Rhypophila decipiens TaxID=261697 RepID=A0AAN6YD10_9PEZI|nr:hypothetical protein QBC37DRAFT_418571 [Rhypophila decipiens]